MSCVATAMSEMIGMIHFQRFKTAIVHTLLLLNGLSFQPFQQFYQLDAYPYAVWYYPPQVMQYIAYTPFYDVTKLTAPENAENVGVVPEWQVSSFT